MTNKRSAFRLFTLLLSIAMLFTSLAVPAQALAARQEKKLQTGQRSLNNPDGEFTLPTTHSIFRVFRVFNKDSWYAGQLILRDLIKHMSSNKAKPQATNILAYAPIVKKTDKLPQHVELTKPEIAKKLFTGGVNNMYIVFKETDKKEYYDVIAIYFNWKGDPFWTTIKMKYDAKTGFLEGADDTGIWGSGYEFDPDQYMSRLPRNNRKRKVGFNKIMDWIGPLVLYNLQTVRFPFEYGGKEWMIQVWKGSYYYVGNGAEIAIYHRPPGRSLQWDASDTELEMTMQLYQKDKLFLNFIEYRSWWAAAFRFANPLLFQIKPPRKLRLTGTIRFEEKGMLEAFMKSFNENKPANMRGKADGLLFSFDWQTGRI